MASQLFWFQWSFPGSDPDWPGVAPAQSRRAGLWKPSNPPKSLSWTFPSQTRHAGVWCSEVEIWDGVHSSSMYLLRESQMVLNADGTPLCVKLAPGGLVPRSRCLLESCLECRRTGGGGDGGPGAAATAAGGSSAPAVGGAAAAAGPSQRKGASHVGGHPTSQRRAGAKRQR